MWNINPSITRLSLRGRQWSSPPTPSMFCRVYIKHLSEIWNTSCSAIYPPNKKKITELTSDGEGHKKKPKQKKTTKPDNDDESISLPFGELIRRQMSFLRMFLSYMIIMFFCSFSYKFKIFIKLASTFLCDVGGRSKPTGDYCYLSNDTWVWTPFKFYAAPIDQ